MKEPQLARTRRISQIVFLVFFLFLLFKTEFRGSLKAVQGDIRLPYPVQIFLQLDPLTAGIKIIIGNQGTGSFRDGFRVLKICMRQHHQIDALVIKRQSLGHGANLAADFIATPRQGINNVSAGRVTTAQEIEAADRADLHRSNRIQPGKQRSQPINFVCLY